MHQRARALCRGRLAARMNPTILATASAKMLVRDDLLDLDVGVERPGQRRVLDDRHAGFLGDLADAQGHGVHALGDALRRRGLALLVAQRDGVVGRVHHHDSGLGHLLDHPAARPLHADLALPGLDVRIAFALPVVFLDLLLGHLHALHEALSLPDEVDHRADSEQGDDREHQFAGDPGRVAQQHGRLHRHQARQLVGARRQDPPGDRAYQDHLQHRAQEVCQPVDAEHALHALAERKLRQVRLQLGGGEEHAALDDVAADASDHGRAQDGEQRRAGGHHHLPGHALAGRAVQLDLIGMGDERQQLVGHAAGHRPAAHRHRAERSGQRADLGQFDRPRDITFLARFLEPARGGVF